MTYFDTDFDWVGIVGLDLRKLLEPGARGDQIPLLGVCAGESAAGLRGVPWESADERDRTSGVYGSSQSEGSLQERVERVICGTGVLRRPRVWVFVEDGVVLRIWVGGGRLEPPLAALNIRKEADILARFGPNEGHERAGSTVVYHYPSRALTVKWDFREGGHLWVALGRDDWREPELGARDLLDNLFHAWSAAAKPWREPPSDPVQRLYYDRAVSLAKALGFGSINEVVKGTFLLEQPPERYASIIKALDDRYGYADECEDTSVMPSDLLRLAYTSLLSYRAKAHSLLHHDTGADAWFGYHTAVFDVTGEISSSLKPMLTLLDAVLEALVDPDQQRIKLSELIERHGFPDEDPLQFRIELEWG